MHPNFKTYEHVKPWGLRVLKERLDPRTVLTEFAVRAEQSLSLLAALPVELKAILQATRNGKLRIEVDLQGYGYVLKKWDQITNRLALTFIICALLITSALLAPIQLPAEYMTRSGLNIFSVSGFIIAAIFIIILGYSILRRRRYK